MYSFARSAWGYLTLICLFTIVIPKHRVHCLEGVQVIVINSNYNNSTVNTANNIESILHGLVVNNEGKNTTGSKSGNDITTANTIAYSTVTTKPPVQTTTLFSNPISKSPQQQPASYFGAAFSPYVRNDAFRMNGYSQEEIQKMLMVIQTKCHSILTFEMGYYANPFFTGPYDATSSAKVATGAAQINLRQNSSLKLFTVSQGAYILATSFSIQRFPDLDAAFYSARKANGIYPGTVSSITLFLQDPNGSEFIGLTQNTAYYAMLLLTQYLSQAHSQNLKLGVTVSFCDQILDSNDDDASLGKQMLLRLASVTDYIICEIYPSMYSSSGTTSEHYNFGSVQSTFEFVNSTFSRIAASLQIILMTGIHSNMYSSLNYINNPMKIKHFWDEVERWSLVTKQKVYLYQAFDTFEKDEIGYGRNQKLNGYWKWAEGGSYFVKATNEVVSA